MIKDILTDIVEHTHNTGFLPICKISEQEDHTLIESIAEKNTVILQARTHNPVEEFTGVFGLSKMDRLNYLLKNPEYKENAKITCIIEERNKKVIPTGIRFVNEAGDFENVFSFINADIVNEKVKSVVALKEPKWDIEFQPSVSSIQRFKLQSSANPEEKLFKVKVEDQNLIFKFGQDASDTGQFVFQPNVSGKLKKQLIWPIEQVQNILNLSGTITMRICADGLMEISVDSGLAKYNYKLVCQTK